MCLRAIGDDYRLFCIDNLRLVMYFYCSDGYRCAMPSIGAFYIWMRTCARMWGNKQTSLNLIDESVL